MAVIRSITPYISRQRIERIEAHCTKINSEEMVERYIALVSARLARDHVIRIKPLKKEDDGEQTA